MRCEALQIKVLVSSLASALFMNCCRLRTENPFTAKFFFFFFLCRKKCKACAETGESKNTFKSHVMRINSFKIQFQIQSFA
jgi:hypothetical protein